jgi:hypothetical protein
MTTVSPLSTITPVVIERLLSEGTPCVKPLMSSFLMLMFMNTRPSVVMVGVTRNSSRASLNAGVASAWPAPAACGVV